MEPLIEEARTLIASSDNYSGLEDELGSDRGNIEGKLVSFRDQKVLIPALVGLSTTAFSFVSIVDYVLVPEF